MLQQVRHIVAFELSCGFGSTAFRSLCTCIKVISVGGVITTTAHAADTIFAGNLAGVVAVQHTPYVITPLVRTADTADSIAAKTGTINYEIICGISRRVPRVYLRDGAPVRIWNDLEET